MSELFRTHKYFFVITIIYLLAGGLLILYVPKGQIEIFINAHHNAFYDYVFQGITFLGDGIFSVLIVLLIFTRSIYLGIVSASAILLTTIITQGLKRLVFADALRPYKFFDSALHLYYIDGLQINSYFSFPSGHTSGAFTLFFFIALISRKPYMDILCFFIAAMVGLSRMYLLQHFFIDTYFGALIGIVFTFLIFVFFEYGTSLRKKASLNRPLFRKNG
jgi:membrane-associated phospholipid phosphatase